MNTKTNQNATADSSCCQVESIVSVDERGQMVLPKDLREKLDIKAGDKLALVTFESSGEVCCVSMIKAEKLGGMVQGLLGPALGMSKEGNL
ncbi:MAG: AbrB/MazE/SpoVT family DNA-binding domain-containing protein [Spirochaetales bacterium]|jgi:antitoxin PrlF|nr:AbrB/MazE/SpoVT family DNA-binding domain-containing protein [Spirochaetales bacterium]